MKTRQEVLPPDGFYRHLREWFTAFLPRQDVYKRQTSTGAMER